ncbi:hypothetical protein HMPREF0758_3707 [Serratia odorifera DSM 4582]|uniref:Uncharacterized protein n=1 Tax=Serratia odorifera DSM 4582 TaxID=667129 RepID=D4E6A7_SEROD|nr:hypothetical protein HMPREF0758_3707 [Serratia odorifera DSM 4582]
MACLSMSEAWAGQRKALFSDIQQKNGQHFLITSALNHCLNNV